MSSYWRSSFALHSCCLGFRRCCLGVCRGMISHLFPHQNTTIRSLLLQGFQLPAMLCSGRAAQPGWAVSRLKAHWSTPKPLISSEGPSRRGVQAGADAHAPTGTEGTASNGRCHPVALRRTGVVVAADEVGSASCGDPGTHHQAWCPDPDHTHPCAAPWPIALLTASDDDEISYPNCSSKPSSKTATTRSAAKLGTAYSQHRSTCERPMGLLRPCNSLPPSQRGKRPLQPHR